VLRLPALSWFVLLSLAEGQGSGQTG
jgi:hypothetical protein